MDKSFRGPRIGPLSFDREKGQWLFRTLRLPACLLEAASSLEMNGHIFSLHQAATARFRTLKTGSAGEEMVLEGTFRFPEPSFSWTLRWEVSSDSSSLILDSAVSNLSNNPFRIGRCFLVDTDVSRGGRLLPGKPFDDGTFLQFGFHDPSPLVSGAGRVENSLPPAGQDSRVESLISNGGIHVSREMCHIYDVGAGRMFLSGFVSFDTAACGHRLRYLRGRGIQEFSAFCDFFGHPLQPGRTLRLERLHLEFSRCPYQALERWVEVVRRRYRPRLNARTPAGWIGWSWVDVTSRREQRAQDVVLENCRAIRKRLAGFPVEYVWISMVNIRDMLPGNWLEFNRHQFPRGVQAALKKIRRLGFKPGFWVAPFWIFADAGRTSRQALPGILRTTTGSPWTRRFRWPYTDVRPGEGRAFRVYSLDGTHPKASAFIRRVFSRYRDMEVRYYMLDFLGGTAGTRPRDPSVTWRAAERILMKEIRAAAGPRTHILTAVGSGMHYIGIADAMRVSTDYGEGRPLYPPFRDFHTATFALNDTVASNHRDTLRNAASSYFAHRRLFINDCNLMTVDKPVSLNNTRITATIFAMTGSPLMLGDDIRRMDGERLELIKKCLPRTREMAFPVDLFTSVYPEKHPRVFSLRVRKPWDEFCIVAVFNFDETPFARTITAEELGIRGGTRQWLYDFWNEEYLGSFAGRFECRVSPRSVNVYRITRARNHPWLLSTDMHVLQGAVEIPCLTWDTRENVLSGSAVRPAGETGNIFLLMPQGFRLLNHEGHWLARDYRDSSVIIRREIRFRKRRMDWRLSFLQDPSAGREGP